MRKVVLIRYGEILLKGLNRPVFERKLIDNIKRAVHHLGKVRVIKSQARIYVEPQVEEYDFDEAVNLLTKVFGIVSVSPVWKIDTDYEVIKEQTIVMLKDLLSRKGYKTFKVESKRGDKSFPMNSPEISKDLGGHILDNFPELSVDVKKPEFIFYVEVREFTYIYSEIIPAVCGMPIGTNG